jgi:hypothetical protein
VRPIAACLEWQVQRRTDAEEKAERPGRPLAALLLRPSDHDLLAFIPI